MRPIDLLIAHHREKHNGVAGFTEGGKSRQVFFRRGEVVFVQSNVRAETLGARLLESGRITREQLLEVLKRMAESGRLQGDILVEIGALTATEVYQQLTQQSVDKLKLTVGMGDCETTFNEVLPESIPHLVVPFYRTVLDGVVEHYPLERFKEELRLNPKAEISIRPDRKQEVLQLALNATELKLLRSAGDKFQVTQFLAASTDKKVAGALLLLLQRLEALEVKSPSGGASLDALFATAEAAVEQHRAPKPTPPPEATAAAEGMYALLLRVQQMSHFGVLQVPEECSATEVERAYHKLIKQYHLNNIDEHYEGKLRQDAKEVLDAVTHAYTVLRNSKRRSEYAKKSYTEQRKSAVRDSPRLQAEIEMLKSEMHLHFGNLEQSAVAADEAARLHPLEPDYLVQVADVQLKLAMQRHDEIVKSLRKALDLEPRHSRAHLLLGHYYKHLEKPEQALHHFGEAARLDSRSAEAQTELRLLEMRHQKGKGKKRGLGR